jgi:hypothetical protein
MMRRRISLPSLPVIVRGSRPAGHHRGREQPFAAAPRGAGGLGPDNPPIPLVGEQLDNLSIQSRRFSIYRCFVEQSRIERAGVGHGILLSATPVRYRKLSRRPSAVFASMIWEEDQCQGSQAK